jgi:hypothetical protein
LKAKACRFEVERLDPSERLQANNRTDRKSNLVSNTVLVDMLNLLRRGRADVAGIIAGILSLGRNVYQCSETASLTCKESVRTSRLHRGI